MLPHLQKARHSDEAYTRMGRRNKKIKTPTHLDLLGVCPSITLPPLSFVPPALVPMLNINRIHRTQPASQFRKVAEAKKNSDIYGSCQPPMGPAVCAEMYKKADVSRARSTFQNSSPGPWIGTDACKNEPPRRVRMIEKLSSRLLQTVFYGEEG